MVSSGAELAGGLIAMQTKTYLAGPAEIPNAASDLSFDSALQLAIINAHNKSLLENARVVRCVARFRIDYLQQLQLVAELKRLPSE